LEGTFSTIDQRRKNSNRTHTLIGCGMEYENKINGQIDAENLNSPMVIPGLFH
jgi:hypothetical protein